MTDSVLHSRPSGAQPKHDRPSASITMLVLLASVLFSAALMWVEVQALVPADFPLNRTAFVLFGRDFLNTWNYANGYFDGTLNAWLDGETYHAMLRQRYGEAFSIHNLSYPPHMLPLIWPLAFLPYGWALAVWSAGGLLAMAATLHLAGLSPRRAPALFWLAFVLPAAIMCLLAGQIGLYAGALLLSGLLLRSTSPVLAGMLFGLLTIKPQLGLLIPLLLLVERRWSVIAAATLTTVTLVALSILMVGVEGWQTYLREVPPVRQAVLTSWGGIMLAMMPTAYINARNIGMGDWASLAQLVATCATLVLFVVVLIRQRDPLWRNFAVLIATACVSPYFFSYDLVSLALAALMLMARDSKAAPESRLTLAMTLVVLAGIILPAITWVTGIAQMPVSAPLMLLMLLAAALHQPVNATARR
ncbi:MAG: DUF2029 domain-containing protein [Phyllobacteriaceae bacterium]|nr:DUF2029 domain-containing protein [Phyllobacteriaceae bacterium]